MKDKEVEVNGEAQIEDGQAQTDGNASFLRAARAGNLDKVLEYLKGSIDINTSNANGLNGLHLASKEGHVSVVTELLKRGANVDAATKKGNSALHIASLAGQEAIVKILVQHGASVNVQSQNGFTPLYMAAQENHDSVVRFLLSNNANQSLATEDGFTPLAVALQQGHDKVVAVLLENDTRGKVRLPALHIASKKDDCKAAALLLQSDHNPDVTSKSGFTPLHIAAHYGNENIANLLLQRGADVNYAAKHNITPMHVASKWGKPNMITLLLDKNATIDAKTRDGLTPLHCAARSGHDQVVDLMLDRGAPIMAKTKNGLAPLHMAAQGDHVDSARILLYHKAPVDDVTVDYLTALHVAAHCGHVRVAKLLLDRKADPNARALNGFTPLHIACKKNRIKVVELLLKHGASIEATTESGLTPLHVASFMGCMNIVIYLIQHGSNPDVPTVRGETPLHLAARANQIDIIRILLRNGAHVDARAREQQTILHIAARLGNADIVALLLQHGATVDATTKDMYTALHIAAKDGQEDVASVLLEHGASLGATTKKGFTPLHLAAKYGNMKVAKLLLQRDAPVDAQGKNGVTPLHVAAHYDHQNVATMLLDKGASPHATAKNGYTPLHIAAKKNQMDIATTLLEYGAKATAESKAGFSPLHLAAQEGHTDMCTLLLEHHADPNSKAKNGLTPMHLCAQEDRVNVAAILAKSGAETDSKTKAGYTPLHVACHFGQINMVRFLLQQGADVNTTTAVGYTPLHQAAQQGHTLIINLLLENRASPNAVTNQGQTALSIAQRLGYISVVETLKVVTETIITTTTTTITEEKYRVVAPETMQETFMSDSEDDGGEDTMFGDQSYQYLTMDEMKSLGDDSMPTMDPLRDERIESTHVFKDNLAAPPPAADEDQLSPVHAKPYAQFTGNYAPDNIDIAHSPVHAGKLKWKTFLVSFMVDARGGAMRGCRHSGVRVIIPPRKAPMPTRITCRYLKKEKLAHPPPLMEGEACASRILEMGPAGAKFLGPVIIEVPHFASLRGKEREITILRSDNGESWREHTLEATEEAVQEVLNDSFDGEELNALEDLNTNRITRILTTDFPQYFAIVTRVRQEVHAIGPEGGMVSSTVVPQVQAVFPEGALTKKIKVGLQAQPIPAELVAKLLGNRVAVSPIVTVEPRRRKFHKPITLTIPVPQAAAKGMINTYSGDTPTLRLLCSITGSTKSGGTTRAQWEDVTGSTPLTFVNDCVSFTTTVSARFWLMDCRNISEATKMATELYREAIHVPFMAKFVVFAKRHDPSEARLRVFCMTDDKEEKTLESQENFLEVAKSRDVEVLEAKAQFVEFAGNLVPVTKSGEQLSLHFHAFRENRLPFMTRVRDPHQDPVGRIAFMREPKVGRGEAPQAPICNLNISLPDIAKTDQSPPEGDLLTIEKRYDYLKEVGISKPETIHKAELRLSDISTLLGKDWVPLALQLDIADSDINVIKSEYPDVDKQAIVMLRLWMQVSGNKATGNTLEKALRKINREDIVNHCIFNVELVTDDVERAVAKVHLDQSGFETLKEELGPSREASLRRDTSLDVSYDEQDIMKEAESAEETSSEAGSLSEHPAPAPAPEIIVSDRKARKAEEETEDDETPSPLVPQRRSKKIVAFEQDIVSKKTEPVRTESTPVQKREKKVAEESPQVEEDETAEGVCVPKRRSVTDIVSQFEVISDKGNGTTSKTEKIQAETDVLELMKMFDQKKEEKQHADAKPVIVTEIYKPLVVEEDMVAEEIQEDVEDVEIIKAQPSLVEKVSPALDTIEDVVTHQAHVLKYEQPQMPQEPLIASSRDDGLVTVLESDISSSSRIFPPEEQRTEIVTEAESHEIADESWEDVAVDVDGEHVGPMEAVTEVHGDVLVCPVAAAHHSMEEVVGILEPLESGAVEAVASLTSKDEERDMHFQKPLHHELPLLQQQQSLSELYLRDDVKVEELITFGDYEKQMREVGDDDDDDDGQEELMRGQGILQEASGKPTQLLTAESSEQVQVHEKPPAEQLVGARTPPPSPVETTQVQVSGVDGKVTTVTTTTKSESGDGGLTKQTVVTTTTVVGQKVATGEPLEAARLAEAEYWASQELERITPDLLDSSRDSQGMVSEEEPITDGHVVKEEWIEKDDSGNVTRKVTKISYDSHKEFPDAHALSEGSRAVGGPASVADATVPNRFDNELEVDTQTRQKLETVSSSAEAVRNISPRVSVIGPLEDDDDDDEVAQAEEGDLDGKKCLPIVTTPLSERKMQLPKPQPLYTQHMPRDVTGTETEWTDEVTSPSSAPVILEPPDDSELLVDRRHSSPDLRKLFAEQDAMPMPPAMAEQRAVAQDTADVEDVFVRPTTPPVTSLPVVSAKPTPTTHSPHISSVPSPTSSAPPRTATLGGVFDSDESVLTKPSPPESPTQMIETEISPPTDYPTKLTPQNQVYVGVSPTEGSDLYDQRKSYVHGPQESSLLISDEGDQSDLGGILTSDASIPRTTSALLSSTSSSSMSFVADQPVSEISDRSDTESTTQASSTATVIHKPDLIDSRDVEVISSPALSERDLEALITSTDPAKESKDIAGDTTLIWTTIESKSSVYTTRTESTGSELDENALMVAEKLAFENQAFAGAEKIDVDDVEDGGSPKRIGATSPFEIPRRSFETTEKTDAFQVEKRFRDEIAQDELADNSDQASQSFEQKNIEKGFSPDEFKKVESHHLRLERHIRTEIFSTELDQAVEAPSPEMKGLIAEFPAEEGVQQFLMQRMRSDIFAGEMEHQVEDLSPEQKELPKFSEFEAFPQSEKGDLNLGKLDIAMPDVVPSSDKSPVRNAKCEQVLWEVPVQEQADADATEVAVEIPPHKQMILEKEEDEEEEQSDVMGEREGGEDADVETSEESTAPMTDRLSATEARHIAEEMIEELKSEVARRPPLRHIPSEISEEDLIERFGGSSDPEDVHPLIGVPAMSQALEKESQPHLLHGNEGQHGEDVDEDSYRDRFDSHIHRQPRLSSEDIRCQFIRVETSSVDITDEELRASDDELSPLEEHMERLQHMKVEENLRRDSFVKISEEHEASMLEREWEAAMHAQQEDSVPKEASGATKSSETATKICSESKSDHESMEKSFSEISYTTAETVRITTKPDGTKLEEDEVIEMKSVKSDIEITLSLKPEFVESDEKHGFVSVTAEKSKLEFDKTTISKTEIVEKSVKAFGKAAEFSEAKTEEFEVIGQEILQEPLDRHAQQTYQYEKSERSRVHEGELEDDHVSDERYMQFHEEVSRESSQETLTAAGSEVSEEERADRRSSTTSSTAPDAPSDTERTKPSVVHRHERRSDPHQVDARSSSGDSPYFSAGTDGGSVTHVLHGTPSTSRPCSSDIETLMSAGVGSSEYETCATSQEETYGTAPTSQEYMSAGSALSHSSRESMPSMDSESSGHLGSLEVSSETSETLVPSALDMIERDGETPTLLGSEDKFTFSSTATTEYLLREPYDTEIPEHVIRGQSEPVGSPYLPDAGPSASSSFMLDSLCAVDSPSSSHIFASAPREEDLDLDKYEDQDVQYAYDYGERRDSSSDSPFEVISDSDLLDYEPGKEFIPEMVSECSSGWLEDREQSDDSDVHESRTGGPRATSGSGSNGKNVSASSERSPLQYTPSQTDEQLKTTLVFRQESGAYVSADRVDEFSDHPLSPEECERALGGDPAGISSTDTSLTASFFSDRQSQATVLAAWDDSGANRSFTQKSEDAADAEEEFGEKGAFPVHVQEVQGQLSDTSTLTVQFVEPPGPASLASSDIYAQANGPVEVEFVPEYDAPEPQNGSLVSDVAAAATITSDTPHADTVSHPPDVVAEIAPYVFRDEVSREGFAAEFTCSSVETRMPERFEQLSSGDADEVRATIEGIGSLEVVVSDEDLSESDMEPDMTPATTPRAVSLELNDKLDPIASGVVFEVLDTDVSASSGRLCTSILPPTRPVSRDLSDTERTESELRDVDMSSRPLSHAESDSDQRPMSEFSDDRPDSELREILRQASNHSEEKELEDIAERPPSPEPLDEYQISEEHVTSPPLPPPRIEGISLPRASSTDVLHDASELPTQREKHEFETSERTYKEKRMHTWSAAYPDITVTQHVSPIREKQDDALPRYDDYDFQEEDIEQHHVLPSAPEMEETGSPTRSFSPIVVQLAGTKVYPDEFDDAIVEKKGDTDASLEKGDFEDTEKEEIDYRDSSEMGASVVWENQLLQQQAESAATSGYLYRMDFEREYEEREELYTHEEEEEDADEEEADDRQNVPVVQDRLEEVIEAKLEHDVSTPKTDSNNTNTPEYDVLAGRRFFSKSGENDDASVSSLQEFERLEMELSRRHSQGSQDSLNGKRPYSRSGQGDDASVCSLQEFEHLEHECVEADKIELIAQEEAARLSEIEEGHESQASEAESQETLSEQEPDEDSDSDDYEQRMFEIDMIIKQAQCNVEKFVDTDDDDRSGVKRHHHRGTHTRSRPDTSASTSKPPVVGIAKKADSGSGGSGGEATESSMVDKTPSAGEDSGDSLDDADEGVSIPRVQEVEDEDSLHEGNAVAEGADEDSEDSLQEDAPTKNPTNLDDCDTDSLKGDSVPHAAKVSISGSTLTEERVTSLTGGGSGGSGDAMASSTDSLDPSSSTATHATYQYETDSIMSSSFASMQTSGEESTMISSTDTFDVDHRVIAGQYQLEQLPGAPASGEVKGAVVVEDNAQFRNGHAGFPTITSKSFTDLEGNVRLQKLLNEYVASTGAAQDSHEKHEQEEEVIVGERGDVPPVIHRSVVMPPELSAVTFTGPDADTKMKEFMESFQPGEDIVETETTDEMGNVHITRTIQRRVIMQPRVESSAEAFVLDDNILSSQRQDAEEIADEEEEVIESEDGHGLVRRIVRRRRVPPPDIRTVSFSGPTAREDMEEYMKKTVGGFQPGRQSQQVETRDEMGNITRVVRHSVEVVESSGDAASSADSRAKVSVHTYYDTPTSPAHAIFHTVPLAGARVTATSRLIESTSSPCEGLSPSGSPKRTPPLPSSSRDSPPSSPTVSSSSHSEDCYCGPEAETETSAQVAFVGAQRTEDKPSWSSSAPEEEHARLMTEGPTMILSKEGHDDHEVTSDTSDSHQEQDSQLREDMQQILENFMAEDQHDHHPNNYQDS